MNVDVPALQRLEMKGHESSDDHCRTVRSAASPGEHTNADVTWALYNGKKFLVKTKLSTSNFKN